MAQRSRAVDCRQTQHFDWRPFRHVAPETTVYGEAIERFCGQIVVKLSEPWISPKERRQLEAEAKRRAKEEERLRQEAEARRKAEERERVRREAALARKRAESAAGEREEAERQRQTSEPAERRRTDEQTRPEVGGHRQAEGDVAQMPDADASETRSQSSRPSSRRDWLISALEAAAIAAGIAGVWKLQDWWKQNKDVQPQTNAAAPSGARRLRDLLGPGSREIPEKQ